MKTSFPYRIAISLLLLLALGACSSGGDGGPAAPGEKSWTVSASAGEGGSVSPASQLVSEGESASVTVTPDEGYSIASISGCNGTLEGNVYTTGEITADCAVSASFTEGPPPVLYTIGAAASPSEGGSVDGGGVYGQGHEVTVSATANTGYHFVHWSEEGSEISTDAAYTFSATGDRLLEAIFAIAQYTVGTSVGDGGSISPDTQAVAHGESTTFTINPDEGYSIADVSGCDGTLEDDVYTTGAITADCTVTASFSLNSYTVTASAGANGSITPASQTVTHGETTTFTVTPDEGYNIAGVSGCNGTLAGDTYTTGAISENCTVSASFTEGPPPVLHTIGVTASPSEGGSVSGGGNYAEGTEVTVSATANTGYDFVNWSEDGSQISTSNSYTFNVEAERSLVAHFALRSYTVTFLDHDGTELKSESVSHGSDATAPADPTRDGHTFTGWDKAFTNVSADLTVNAQYEINNYTVTASAGANGSITPASRTVAYGETTTFTVSPDSGYLIDTVTGCGGTLSGTTYTTGTISGDCTVSASFSAISHTISASAVPAEGGSVTGDGTYNHNTEVTLTASANTGYNFVNWTEDGSEVSTNTSYVFNAAADRTLVANFSVINYTVSTNVGAGGAIDPIEAIVEYGTTTSFTLTPDDGYNIANVTGCDGALSGTTYTTGQVFADCEIEATFVRPLEMQSFVKTSEYTLAWTTANATSCEITNNQNSEVLNVRADSLTSGTALHPLPADATFTITCQGEDGSSASLSATAVGTNPFPQTVGYYGSPSSMNNSWLAIVNLSTPVDFTDRHDFNAKVDSYCSDLGYVGVAKTGTGAFSTHSTHYLSNDRGITGVSAPSRKVTLIPGDAIHTNVYTNASHWDNSWGDVARASIGENAATNTATSVAGPTSGEDQMVLCQTDIRLGNTTSLPQAISFSNPGPIRKVQGVDEDTFVNSASGGLGLGQITYESSDPSVATVNETNGTVTLVSLGTTTITATKAADAFVEAQASYTLMVDSPQPIDLQSFTKTSENTLSWTTGETGTLSCEITNDQNSEVLTVVASNLTSGMALHPLPAETTFTITCQGEDGSSASLSATAVGTNPFPETVGYYGSASSMDNSWVAIVNLSTPIDFTDRIDFNSQVDSYCSGLGYIGAVKTKTGSFSVHDTYYLQSGDGIIAGSGPVDKVTLIPGDAVYTNVYTNRRNTDSSLGNPGRATIGDNASSIDTSITSPTSGENQMVLCQTSIRFGGNTTSLPQAISFSNPGPIRKVQGLDADTFVNTASGGLGKGVITYVSSDPSVATVNETNGTVTLVGLGSTTITATKAADAFVEAQASYTLTVDSPQPIDLQSFTKTSENTLSWTTGETGTLSCEITNDQNSEVLTVAADSLTSGMALHPLPAETTFTITCQGEDGSSASLSATTVGTNPFPETVGYYGSASSMDNSWVAIVNLTTPITFTDKFDFNSQVDSYCSGLGYVGAVKTMTGNLSTHDTYYLQTAWGVITGNGPSKKVTVIPGDATFTNIYANETNYDTFADVKRVTIGDNSSYGTSTSSPTSGENQMVLCQTDIKLGNTTSLPQTISFSKPGPIRKVQGLDEDTFVNTASGGLGSGAITYSSSDPAVATVDENTGTVTLVALGTTTITATKAADAFVEAQASYTLTVDSPKAINFKSFIKSTDNTLRWATDYAVSCEITNDQNSEVITLTREDANKGNALHTLPAGAVFTLTCEGETGTTASTTVSAVTNLYPQTMGYYGAISSVSNSWLAIVNLTTPIDFTDYLDFNSQVDSYCAGLGYVGVAKTRPGDFSTHTTYYLHGNYGVTGSFAPATSDRVTVTPDDMIYTNVYTNGTHLHNRGSVDRVSIGNNSVRTSSYSLTGPTSGDNQMVLCQTDIPFRTSALLPQMISFAEPGPIRKIMGLDEMTFVNAASGGKGSGAITYASSNPAVAMVDENDGTISLIDLGSTTITATKAADAYFQEAQASYVLNYEIPQNIEMQSFTKTGDSTLAWTVKWAVSCDITNDQNSVVTSVVLDKDAAGVSSGRLLHGMPSDTVFTLTCEGETGSIDSLVATAGTNPFTETVGYYGSANSMDNSWVAIVNLANPIEFTDEIDFNNKVDSYCTGLGYIGAAKTKLADFSQHDTYYLQSSNSVVWAVSAVVTLIPGDVTYTNVYTNRRHYVGSLGRVVRASIGNNNSAATADATSPTSGVDQMVLCQTDISFRETALIEQTVSFSDPGPVFKTLGVDTTFTNRAYGSIVSSPITYVSSNPGVATVDAYGTVTLVSTGTTTITATIKPESGFIEAQASYTLDVQ